jgi:DNA repair exonuclease SbcCD ATPase subunit
MVRITRLRLKNFAVIKTTMGVDEIEIDRSKSNNVLTILMGQNGSGKSFLCSQLTPSVFEHTKGRTSLNIIPDKTGEKDLDIVLDYKYLYKIHIIYDKHKTSAFITKENIITKENLGELNPNGNIKSYYEVVEKELGWTQSYINVGYLSNAITSIVMMKATERNEYISIWMPLLSQYLDGYKLAMKQYNSIKKQIDLLNNDINKLSGITYESEINNLNSSIETIEKEYNEIIYHITKSETYSNLFPDINEQDMKERIRLFKDKVNELDNIRNNLNNEINELKSYIGTNGKDKIKNDINELSTSSLLLEKELTNIDNNLSDLNNSFKNNNIDTSKDLSIFENEINTLKSLLSDITDEIIKLKSIKDNQLKDNSVLSDLLDISDKKYQEIVNFIDIIKSSFNIISSHISLAYLDNETIFNNRYNEILSFKEKYSDMKDNLDKEISLISNKIYALQNSTLTKDLLDLKPSICNIKCGIIDEILKYINPDNEIKILKDKIDSLVKEKISLNKMLEDNDSDIRDMTYANRLIVDMNDLLFKKNEIIGTFPEFIKNFFLNDIYYILKNIEDFSSKSSIWSEFIALNEKIKEDEILLERKNEIYKSITLENEFYKKHKESLEELMKLQDKRSSIINSYKETQSKKDKLIELSSLIDNYKEKVNKYNEMADSLLNKKILLKKEVKRSYLKYCLIRNINIFTARKIEKKLSLDNLLEEKNNLQSKYNTLNILTDNRDKYIKKNEKLYAILNIWSPKVGYPAWEMENFLDTLTEQTNKDLSQMWGSSLSIEEFIIGANEFSICINRNGTILKDVSECSEGEKATLSLAISFAIIEINLRYRKYNVIRLDETDATLDTERRQSFLNTILNRVNSLDCNDLWIITHNNFVNDVEADIILLKGADLTDINLTNKNVIYKV